LELANEKTTRRRYQKRGVEAELKEASDPSEPEAELAETEGADRNAKLEEQREKGTVGR
jgi:hypothetical protein